MRDASKPKLNLATKIFHVDSFVVLFSSIFLLCGNLKFDLMFFIKLIRQLEHVRLLKNLIKQKCSKFYCIPDQIYLIHQIRLN